VQESDQRWANRRATSSSRRWRSLLENRWTLASAFECSRRCLTRSTDESLVGELMSNNIVDLLSNQLSRVWSSEWIDCIELRRTRRDSKWIPPPCLQTPKHRLPLQPETTLKSHHQAWYHHQQYGYRHNIGYVGRGWVYHSLVVVWLSHGGSMSGCKSVAGTAESIVNVGGGPAAAEEETPSSCFTSSPRVVRTETQTHENNNNNNDINDNVVTFIFHQPTLSES